MKDVFLNKEISFDLPKLIESRLLVQANSGGGKSWALRRLLEQSHGKVQHIILDSEGEFGTLREKYDYVLAGKGGDTVADPRSASLLATKLLELKASAIIDLYELHPSERKKFVRLFLESIINAPKELWHECLIVVDEAHIYAPEKGKSEAMDAVIGLCALGRKRGFCAVLATQRISKLHKDAVAECNNKLIGRASIDIDMKRAGDELGFTSKEQMLSLRKLKPGEFYVFGPAISDEVELITIGEVKTTHPKAGSRSLTKVVPPTSAIKKILGKLADLPKEAEEELRTISDLQAKIRKLESEKRLIEPRNNVTDPKAIENAVKKVVDDINHRLIKPLVQENKKKSEILASLKEIIGKWEITIPDTEALIKEYQQYTYTVTQQTSSTIKPSIYPASITESIKEAGKEFAKEMDQVVLDTARDITTTQQRVLDAIAWFEAIGFARPSKQQVGFVAGYRAGKKIGGTYANILGGLRSSGLITYPTPGDVELTEEGRMRSFTPDIAPTSEAVQEAVFACLNNVERKILQVVIDNHPSEISKQELGALSGYVVGEKVGGTFANILGRLRTLGLIDYPTPGMVKGTDVLFINN